MRTSFRKPLEIWLRFFWYIAVAASTSILPVRTLAGTLTVNGNLTVSTNLTAQSITLGGTTQTSWNFLAPQGYKYVTVTEGTNDVQRGGNLKAAYTTATTLSPTSSNRVAVIVPPGGYNLGSTGLTMNTSYVDLIGLVPAQMTSKQVFTNAVGGLSTKTVANVQCPVRIYAALSGTSATIKQTVDNVRIESVVLTNTSTGACYYPTVSGTNTVLRYVSMPSMGDGDYAGQYVDCVSGDNGFGGGHTASGTFIGCVGGYASFGGYSGTASGTFMDCGGGDSSFGGDYYGVASGVFMGCVGGQNSFGSDGVASGSFTACVGGDGSFGGDNGDGGTAAGTFINCVGGSYSFGGDRGQNGATLDYAAKLQHCKGGAGSFGGYGASDDFNYNTAGATTFAMSLKLLQLPTSTNGLPSGTVYNSSGTLKIMP